MEKEIQESFFVFSAYSVVTFAGTDLFFPLPPLLG
jgi:hypothetical protein